MNTMIGNSYPQLDKMMSVGSQATGQTKDRESAFGELMGSAGKAKPKDKESNQESEDISKDKPVSNRHLMGAEAMMSMLFNGQLTLGQNVGQVLTSDAWAAAVAGMPGVEAALGKPGDSTMQGQVFAEAADNPMLMDMAGTEMAALEVGVEAVKQEMPKTTKQSETEIMPETDLNMPETQKIPGSDIQQDGEADMAEGNDVNQQKFQVDKPGTAKQEKETITTYQEGAVAAMESLQTANQAKAPDEAVHVQVSSMEEIPQKLMDQIEVKTAQGQKEFEVQLEPQNLGKIVIKVSQGIQGTTVSLMCTEQKTLQMLSEKAGDMGTILETNLGEPTAIFVDKQETSYLNQEREGNGRQERNQEEEHPAKHQDDDDIPVDFAQRFRLQVVHGL